MLRFDSLKSPSALPLVQKLARLEKARPHAYRIVERLVDDLLR
jgi:hypothetical protein